MVGSDGVGSIGAGLLGPGSPCCLGHFNIHIGVDVSRLGSSFLVPMVVSLLAVGFGVEDPHSRLVSLSDPNVLLSYLGIGSSRITPSFSFLLLFQASLLETLV